MTFADASSDNLARPLEDELSAPAEMPLCLHCLAPVHPLEHYCPRCGEAVGSFTSYIPFVNIRFEVSFFERLWDRLWHEPRAPIWSRVVSVAVIALLAPIMLVGLPFVLYRRARRRTAK